MNREIKFRAWDKRRQKMIGTDYPNNWGTNNEEWYTDNEMICLTAIEEIAKNGNFEIMQYTGLKDKNGKEIYEGDIVKINHPCWAERGKIMFFNGSFIFEQIFSTSDSKVIVEFPDLARQKNWEVQIVGNIHEHPELLKS